MNPALPRSRHQAAIDEIVVGTEMADRYLLSWAERAEDGRILQCSTRVCSRQLGRRIIDTLFMHDDNVAHINFTPIS